MIQKAAPAARKVWTEPELQALPDVGYIYEVVDGGLVMSPKASGTQLAWVIDAEGERVEVCHSPTDRKLTASGGFLDGESLLPGFHYPISDLFRELGR